MKPVYLTTNLVLYAHIVTVLGGPAPGCDWYGGRLSVGEEFKLDANMFPAYTCYDCKCEATGYVWCYRQCPGLTCARELQEQTAGECCPTCRDGCGYRGNVYQYGDVVPADPCATCICQDSGLISCAKNLCPPAPCPEEWREILEGECCQTCKPGAPTFCFFDGQQYEVGEKVMPRADTTTCDQCTCKDNGLVACTCERPKCPEEMQEKPAGECCTRCKPDATETWDCFYGGEGYHANQTLPEAVVNTIKETFNQPCIGSCICESDEGLVCYYRDPCPQLNCENRVKPEGECCEVCSEV